VEDPRKQAEIDYPERVGEEGRAWLRSKPFVNSPREVSRHLLDFGYVVQLLEPVPGMRVLHLACGSGWMSRLLARCGVEVVGYDISPGMIEIAREQAAHEGLDGTRFEVADMEHLELDHSFDACLVYDGLHHSDRPDLVLRCARSGLRGGGRLLLAEPNWKHRYGGRGASDEWGTHELGYSTRRLKRLARSAGFVDLERFHNNRLRLYSNAPLDTLMHLAEPITYRVLGPFWTRIWLRARAGDRPQAR
jgi:2-polyprenyl-3-methyl-5-hydroxy-6-metoxy-1,4-benzoquinol methylase